MITVEQAMFAIFIEEKTSEYGEVTTSLYQEEDTLERITYYVDGLHVIGMETHLLQTGEIIYQINSLDQQTTY
jgi:hypothetical protein